jgi:hypothetical protein
MTRDEVFKCSKLKSTFTVWRCVRNQKDALDFWGPNASKFQSCPCDQGIEIRQQMEGEVMSVHKECRNCGRIMAISQDGMCGGCFNRGKHLEGQDKLEALAQAKEDFEGRGPLTTGKRGPRIIAGKKAEKPLSTKHSSRKPDRKESTTIFSPMPTRDDQDPKLAKAFDLPDVQVSRDIVETFAAYQIILHFDDGDEKLYAGLKALARKYRRTPDQQLLWLLEHELTNEGYLLLEADRTEAAHG